MKILFTNTWYAPHIAGGGERSVQFLAESLVEKGHQAVVICTGEHKGVDVTEINGVKVYRVGIKNLYWPFPTRQPNKLLKPAWHLIDSFNRFMSEIVKNITRTEVPDVVHSNGITGLSVAIFHPVRILGVPIVHTLRNYYLMCPQGDMFRYGDNCNQSCARCRLLSVPRKKATARIDAVVGVSRHILNAHLQRGYFVETPIREVIYNSYRPARAVNANISGTGNRITLGYIGRLHPTKGIEYLLEAMKDLPRNDYELIVAGEGKPSYEQHLSARFRGDNIKFIGPTPTEDFFSLIDLLIVPSIWNEPLGRVILESYANGVPVVVTDVGGCAEIVDHEETGIVIPPGSAYAIVGAVKKIHRHHLELMSKSAQAKSVEFLPDTILSQYMRLYETVVG